MYKGLTKKIHYSNFLFEVLEIVFKDITLFLLHGDIMKKIATVLLIMLSVFAFATELDFLSVVNKVESWILQTYEKDSITYDVGKKKVLAIVESDKSDAEKIKELKAEFPKAFEEEVAEVAEVDIEEALQKIYEEGLKYFTGDGVNQDSVKAAKLFKEAAEQGHAESQFSLGVCYSLGVFGEKDQVAAAAWYRKAVDQGYAKAQFCLAGLLLSGDGVTQNKEEAETLLAKAAKLGLVEAQEALKALQAK